MKSSAATLDNGDRRDACPTVVRIPVAFIEQVPVARLAVDDEGLAVLLGVEKRTPLARKKACLRFRQRYGIAKLEGGVFSIKAVEQGINAETRRARRKSV